MEDAVANEDQKPGPDQALVIRPEDVGRLVYEKPELFPNGAKDWLANPDYDFGTQSVVLKDEETGSLGILSTRFYGKGTCVNAREALVRFLGEHHRGELFASQQAAIRAALAYEREYARNVLKACDEVERNLGLFG